MKRLMKTTLAALTMMTASSVFADHNSMNGPGWANMPNDIHNTRIDTLGGDNSEFTDFVRYGNGADSVNRFADDETSIRGQRSDSGSSSSTSTRSMQRTMTQSRQRAGSGRGGKH